MRRGTFGVVQADDERDMFTYARFDEADVLPVTLNRSEAAHSARVPLPDSLQQPCEVPEDAAVRLQKDESALLLEVPGHAGVVLRRVRGPFVFPKNLLARRTEPATIAIRLWFVENP